MLLLLLKEGIYRLRATRYAVVAISNAGSQESLVQFFEALDNGDGYQVVAPDGPFRPPFFITAFRIAEPGFKIIIGPELPEARLFDPLSPPEDFLNGAREVVVNYSGEYSAKESEDMGIKKGFLLLAWICLYEMLARKASSHAEEKYGCPHALYYGKASAPVGFRLSSAIWFQDQEYSGRLRPQACLGQAHVASYIYFASPESFLFDEAGVNIRRAVCLCFLGLSQSAFNQPSMIARYAPNIGYG